MAEDRTTITADASQYFDVLQRAGAAGARFARTGDEIGAGFVRGERVVRTASANIAAGLLTTSSAATQALIVLQGLERVFKIGILPTVAIAGAVAVLETFHKQIERTNKASRELHDELAKPIALQITGTPEALTSDIDKLREKMSGLEKQTNSTTSAILRFLNRGTPGGPRGGLEDIQAGLPRPPGITSPISKEQEQLVRGAERLAQLESARAETELRIANLKAQSNKEGEEAATIANAEADAASKTAKLQEEFLKGGGGILNFYQRFLAIQVTLGATIRDQIQKTADKSADALSKLGQSTKDFFTRVGSGEFIKDFQQQQLRAQQEQRGRELVAELQDAQERGVGLSPELQAILEEAQKIGRGAGVSITDLVNTDFTNLLTLSTYDFSGLEPLSGLTINIQ